ncbi:MAG: zinc/manganese transport system substrate-binding protein [Holophagaceae bacterium]|nr:zinc/manganese transport system substrate-binding protein [Holophagaceae bacterium]
MNKAMQVCVLCLLACLSACDRRPAAKVGRRTIVVTYAVLGSITRELAGDDFEVRTLIPNGLDIHEWEPSARDIEALTRADLVVENGLGLEGGLGKALDQARKAGVPFFTASDYIRVRIVGAGEGLPTGDPDQAPGARDPHLWTDPLAVKAVAGALAGDIQRRFGRDLSARNRELGTRLDALDLEIRKTVDALPVERRKLVTGHESLGYFAQRYGFTLVGAVIPGMSTEGAGSAASMARLKRLIREQGVTAIFTEVGTSPRTVEALARETQVRALPLATHTLPADGSYLSFGRELANTILGGLQ